VEQQIAAPVDHVEAYRGRYADSVTLMQVSTTVAEIEDVSAATIVIATELNLEMRSGMGFARPEATLPNYSRPPCVPTG
jgi:FdrA protein